MNVEGLSSTLTIDVNPIDGEKADRHGDDET